MPRGKVDGRRGVGFGLVEQGWVSGEIEEPEFFDVVFLPAWIADPCQAVCLYYLAMCHDSTLQIGIEKCALYVEIEQIVHTTLL
jgi:hypothetical protein